MFGRLPWFLMVLVLFLVIAPLLALAQTVAPAAPELPAFLAQFAAGHWWVVPAYGLTVLIVGALDATFFTEDWKATWPAWLRNGWNVVALNFWKSRNEGSA